MQTTVNKELKEQLSKTTKATKLAKGQKTIKQDELDEVIEEKLGENVQLEQYSEDEDKRSEEFMDIDGLVK